MAAPAAAGGDSVDDEAATEHGQQRDARVVEMVGRAQRLFTWDADTDAELDRPINQSINLLAWMHHTHRTWRWAKWTTPWPRRWRGRTRGKAVSLHKRGRRGGKGAGGGWGLGRWRPCCGRARGRRRRRTGRRRSGPRSRSFEWARGADDQAAERVVGEMRRDKTKFKKKRDLLSISHLVQFISHQSDA